MAVKQNRTPYTNPKNVHLKPLTGLSPFLVIELRNLIHTEHEVTPKNKPIKFKFKFRTGSTFTPLGVSEVAPDFFKLYSIDEHNYTHLITTFTGDDLINEYKAVQSVT